MTKSSWILAVILLLALGVRLGIGAFLGFNSGPDQAACGADTVEFEHMAWSAAQGNGFALYKGGPPTAFRAPGYPMVLAGLYRIFGRAYWVNRIALSLLGTGTCWLIYLLTLQLRLTRATALVAALIVALLPLQFYWCGHFMSEPVATFLNAAATLLLVMAMQSSSLQVFHHSTTPSHHHTITLSLFFAGIICGLSTLARAASMLVPVVFAGLLLLSRRVGLRSLVVKVAVFGVGLAIVIAPWAARNVVVLNRFALVSTNGGSTFWGANNDVVATPGEKWGSWISTTHIDRVRKEKEVWSLSNEVDRDRKEWALGKEWVRENLAKLPTLLVGKVYRLVQPFPQSANRVYVCIVGLGWIALLPLSLMGMTLLLRNPDARHRLIPVNAQLLTLLATTALFYGSERFRAPYEPFLAIYAAAGLSWVVERTRSRCLNRR